MAYLKAYQFIICCHCHYTVYLLLQATSVDDGSTRGLHWDCVHLWGRLSRSTSQGSTWRLPEKSQGPLTHRFVWYNMVMKFIFWKLVVLVSSNFRKLKHESNQICLLTIVPFWGEGYKLCKISEDTIMCTDFANLGCGYGPYWDSFVNVFVHLIITFSNWALRSNIRGVLFYCWKSYSDF